MRAGISSDRSSSRRSGMSLFPSPLRGGARGGGAGAGVCRSCRAAHLQRLVKCRVDRVQNAVDASHYVHIGKTQHSEAAMVEPCRARVILFGERLPTVMIAV